MTKYWLASLAAIVLVLFTPAAASAHSGRSVDATGYKSQLVGVEPALIDADVSVAYLGDQLMIVNNGPEITVLGYEDEPYIRVGPDGVFENRNSPATYLNESQEADNPVPDFASAQKEPDWQKISDGRIASWHDHDIHWMNESDSPLVVAQPNIAHTIFERWEVSMQQDGKDITAFGTLTWEPAPSSTPWWIAIGIVAAMGAVAVVVIARTKRSLIYTRGAAVLIALLIVANLIQTAGVVADFLSGPAPRFTDSMHLGVPQLMAAATGLVALRRTLKREHGAQWFLIFTGFVLFYGTGVTFLGDISYSQIYFDWGLTLDRWLVAASLSGGAVLVAVAIAELWQERNQTRSSGLIDLGSEGLDSTVSPSR